MSLKFILHVFTGLMAFFLILPAAAVASEAGEENHGKHEYRHDLSVFLGATRAEGENLETAGIEYAYRINENWKVGALVERAVRVSDSTLVIAFASFHPYKGWFIGGGLGRKDPGPDRENTARLSFGYEFEFGGGWLLSPQIHKDFIENEEDEEVFGLAIGRNF